MIVASTTSKLPTPNSRAISSAMAKPTAPASATASQRPTSSTASMPARATPSISTSASPTSPSMPPAFQLGNLTILIHNSYLSLSNQGDRHGVTRGLEFLGTDGHGIIFFCADDFKKSVSVRVHPCLNKKVRVHPCPSVPK